MCGIQLEVTVLGDGSDHEQQQPTENLSRRGPDHLGTVHLDYGNSASNSAANQDQHIRHRVALHASVLTMRADSIHQPVTIACSRDGVPKNALQNAASSNSTAFPIHLCWNGEVYQRLTNTANTPTDKTEIIRDHDMETVAGYDVADTQLVAEMIQEAHGKILMSAKSGVDPSLFFLNQYASSLAQNVFGRLINAEYAFCLLTPWAIYYGRDPRGRRSLLWQHKQDSAKDDSSDIDEDGGPRSWRLASVMEQQDNNGADNRTIWNEVIPGMVHEYRFSTGETHSTPIPQYPLQSQAPSLNVGMQAPENVSPSMWKASRELEHYLREAVRLRVCGTTNDGTEANSSRQQHHQHQQSVAVLFSGGVDSVVLAALALQVLSPNVPLRLWNVSFVDKVQTKPTEDNRSMPTTTATTTKSQDCRAAQASYEELLVLFPNRQIRLETSEVGWEEMTQWESHVRTLMHPKTTTMDLNIAMALWFASRGRQYNAISANDDTQTVNNTSGKQLDRGIDDEDPRILLLGMGADEQLGGYGRHRKAFERGSKTQDRYTSKYYDSTVGGNVGLRQELDMDIERIWERNLGRDDRILSDHGKEARFPYLDPRVMRFLAQTPLEDIVDYTLPPGEGDKRVLRLLAIRLGLKTASGMVKRAIQFGSRISHVSDKRRFGSRRKAKGNANV